MKKANLLALFICLGLVAIMLAPVVAHAQTDLWWNLGLSSLKKPFSSSWTLMDVISTIINLAFAIAGIVAVVYLIMGGFNYVTAGGNPEAVDGAKTTLVNAIIGLVVILVSYLIIQFVMSQIGANVELNNRYYW